MGMAAACPFTDNTFGCASLFLEMRCLALPLATPCWYKVIHRINSPVIIVINGTIRNVFWSE
jgi:hypothetical protein